MAAYGEIRMTQDIDIVVELLPPDAQRFFTAFEGDKYYISDTSIRRAIDRLSMFNIVNNTQGGKIGCIIKKDTAFAAASFSRRYRVSVAGVEYWNSTREDLIVSKLLWAKDTKSEIQIRDIANLTDADYDSNYVEKWISQLELDEIWGDVEQWKIQHKPLDD